MDPDVSASQFCIDMKEFNGEPSLVFMDNGCGLTPERLHKMLSFGHSKKQMTPGDKSIGKHGNGFKSGTMRLGKDVLVLTKCSTSMTAGFLSQTFLADTGAEDVLIPQISWDLRGNRIYSEDNDSEESLQAICNYSIFPDEASLLSQLDAIPGTGAILIISNLRRHEGVLELDFKTDPHDIRITTAITNSHYQQLRPNQPNSTDVPIDYSLRAYVAILYKVPRMQIFIRDKKVKTKRITGILSQKETETYRPMGILESIKIELGFNTENKSLYGMMLYHRNRLIKPYMRVGIQLEENEKGMGVLGIVEADFLQPTHNKQDFDDTTAYRRLLKKLSDVLAEYWWEKKERVTSLPHVETRSRPLTQADATEDVPDVVWVQCDDPSCLKWRVLPDGTDPASLPDVWYCTYHPNPRYRRHEEPEQEWDASVPHEIVERRKERKREYDREKKEREAQRKRQRLEAITKDEQLSLQKQKEAAMKELEDQRSREKIILDEERKRHEEEVKKLQEEYAHMQAKRDEIMKENNDLLKQLEKAREENDMQEALASMEEQKEIFSTQVSESDQFSQQEEELNSAEFIQDKHQLGPVHVNDMSHIFNDISEVPDASSMLAEEPMYHNNVNDSAREKDSQEVVLMRSFQPLNHQHLEQQNKTNFHPLSADHFLQLSSGQFSNEQANPSFTQKAQVTQGGVLQRPGNLQTSANSAMAHKEFISHAGSSSRDMRSTVTSAPILNTLSTLGHNISQLSAIPTNSLDRPYHVHREGFGWSQESDIASTTSRYKTGEASLSIMPGMPRGMPPVTAAPMPETPSPSCMPAFTSSFSPVAVESQTTSLTSSSLTPTLTQQFLVEANASLNRGPNTLTLQDFQDVQLPASGSNALFDQRPVISLMDRSESERRQSMQFQVHNASSRSDIQERLANTAGASFSGRLADPHPSNLSLGPGMLSAQLPLDRVLSNRNSVSETEVHIDKAVFSLQRRLRVALHTLRKIGGSSEAHLMDLDELPSTDLEVLTICEKTKNLVEMRWQSYEQEIQKLKAELAYTMTDKLQNGHSFRIQSLADNWGVGVGLSK
ncbi:hypothetical protein O6H91_21G008800 [Diphasiastrum complanatum]|uniref:Uncharacterized protein n=1 Tax=Diphasiastrum complanatum TaxID=34168 RepID=A0ACC2AHH8_DIPCM|nr:hypothetical protein O6H91_21G008800 [Diphasiastrum complanatum]